MDLYRSEKNFLERLADKLPGLAGYRERESRRDTDKRVRDHLARRLDRARQGVDAARREATGRGDLEKLGRLGEIDSRVRRAADGLRHATYGYTGAFDQVRMRDDELERIYRFDLELLDEVEAVESALEALAGAGPAATLEATDRLLRRIAERRELFDAPQGGAGR
jgi:hypothetical protein